METAFDANITPRIMLTVVTLIYATALTVADFNKTHVFNMEWTPHGRFHVCWQILSYVGMAIMGLILLWADFGAYLLQLNIAAGLIGCVMGAFYISLLTMKLYSGHNYDETGIKPTPVKLFGVTLWFDANITVFTALTTLLIISWFQIG